MGLFHFLKNGLTIEKKSEEIEDTVTEETATDTEVMEEDDATIEEETVTEAETPPEVTPTPVQAATPHTTAEKRLEAECILYSNLTNPPTSAPITPTTTIPPTEIVKEQPPQPQIQTFSNYSNHATGSFNNALMGQSLANQNLLVIAPKTANEISAILSNLASGNACIVSLAQIPDAQRHLDFMCGFVSAIEGKIMQRSSTEYILTPKGVGIRNA